MFISPTKAVQLFKVSKPTLYKDMDTGKLSFQKDTRKKRKINIAELERIYEKRTDNEPNQNSENVKNRSVSKNENVNDDIKKEIDIIHEQINQTHKREVELLNNQIDQLQNQIESINKSLHKALDVTALLENKREGQGDREAQRDVKLEGMEKQIEKLKEQNSLLIAKEEERRKRREQRKKTT